MMMSDGIPQQVAKVLGVGDFFCARRVVAGMLPMGFTGTMEEKRTNGIIASEKTCPNLGY